MDESAPPPSTVLAEPAFGASRLNSAPPQPSPGMVEVCVDEASEVDSVVNHAIAQVMEAAKRHHLGIMVTRLDTGWYIVRVHPEVPFGLTRQQYH